MGFYGSHCHFELGGNFGVVTTLQKQFNNLLFARTESNGLLLHLIPSFLFYSSSPIRRTPDSFAKFILVFLYIKRTN
jgi:hypothetical protein